MKENQQTVENYEKLQQKSHAAAPGYPTFISIQSSCDKATPGDRRTG